MLTPFIRVGVSIVYFMGVLRNWKYTCFTAAVLLVLTYSLFLRLPLPYRNGWQQTFLQ